MIQIKLREDDNWRLVISDEQWEFNSREELFQTINKIMDLKEKYGRIKNNQY